MNSRKLGFSMVVFCAFSLAAALTCRAQTSTSSRVAGNWQGTLVAPGTKLKVILNLSQDVGGPLTGTLDLPDEGAIGLPLSQLSYADRILSFDVNVGAASHYEGVVSRDATEVVGYFSQGPAPVLLSFTHSDAKPDSNALKPAILTSSKRKLDLQPCGQAGLTKDALCSQYEVYEDRPKNSGRKIKLNVMLLPALVDKPAPDPIFYFQGGPGGAATAFAVSPAMPQLRRARDVVLVDQRGTGKSNPLQCYSRGDPNDMRGYFAEGLTTELLKTCRAELEKNADLRLYTTTIAMADLDDVRKALGYDKINVYGGSYGATAALSYLNFYPQHVRTVTVAGVAPPDDTLLVSFAQGVEHALNRLFDDCAADEKCKAAFPDLRQDWARVVATLDKGPVTFDTLNPLTRQKQQLTMTRDGFAELVRFILYRPDVMRAMPLMIHQMSQGDYSRFAYHAYEVQRVIDTSLARGMQLSVLCAEDVSFIKESDIDAETRGTFYGGSRVHLLIKLCQQWPRGDMPAKYREPIKSEVPVLMLSGELDPVTPPQIAAPLLKWLPNGRQVILRNATHAPYECQDKLVREFIDRGTAKDLDTSCAEGIKRWPFVTSLPPLPIPK
jgi:pimeloyl-ACP methyl ester carboxylesterase